MRYVLDASAALCWVLPRPNSGKALQLRAEFQNAVHELIAPSVFSGEVASALTKAERQKLIQVGDARPLLGRIMAVVDAYSAITSDRPFRKGQSHRVAVAELRRNTGTQFDPDLAERFIEVMESRRKEEAAA